MSHYLNDPPWWKNGDHLLVMNLMILNLAFIPTLLDPTTKISPLTAVVYVGSLSTGLCGYLLNRQKGPAISMVVAALLWAAMFVKSVTHAW